MKLRILCVTKKTRNVHINVTLRRVRATIVVVEMQ